MSNRHQNSELLSLDILKQPTIIQIDNRSPVLSGEHSSELRPDTLLASDGCEGLGPGLVMVMVTIPLFFSIFQWK